MNKMILIYIININVNVNVGSRHVKTNVKDLEYEI